MSVNHKIKKSGLMEINQLRIQACINTKQTNIIAELYPNMVYREIGNYSANNKTSKK